MIRSVVMARLYTHIPETVRVEEVELIPAHRGIENLLHPCAAGA